MNTVPRPIQCSDRMAPRTDQLAMSTSRLRMKFTWLIAVVVFLVTAGQTVHADTVSPSFCEKHRAYAESVMASRQIGLNKSVLERSVLKALAGGNNNPRMALLLTATINRAYQVPFQKQQTAKQAATQQFARSEYQRCQQAMLSTNSRVE